MSPPRPGHHQGGKAVHGHCQRWDHHPIHTMTTAAQIHHQFHHQGGVHHDGGAHHQGRGHHQGWGSPCRSGGQHRFEVTSRGSPLRQGHQRRGVTTKVGRQRRGITTKGRSPSLPPRRVTTKAGLVISRTGVTTKTKAKPQRSLQKNINPK